MISAVLTSLLTVFPCRVALAASTHQLQVSRQRMFTCDSVVEDEARNLRRHPKKPAEIISSLRVVDVPIAYCNEMGDDNEWYSFTSKEKNEAAVDWVMRIQVIERYFHTKLSANWIGSTKIDASEEALLESRRNALLMKNGKCRAFYSWKTQGIYFLPPPGTQAEIIKQVRAMAKRKHLL